MATASLIGLGLVVLGVSALSSLMLSAALLLGQARLRSAGPWAERRAATLTLVLPPLIGLGVATTIAATNLAAYLTGTDHCLGHSHHLHLCPVHGGHWTSMPWAVAVIASFSAYLLVRIGQAAWAHLIAQRAVSRLRRSGTPIAGHRRSLMVESEQRFAFTADLLFPTVIVSRAAWLGLDEDQRAALLAHEQAHIAHGDLWKRALLRLLTSFGVPLLAQRAVEIWELAAERACDRDAARAVGRPSIVASAILSLARSSGTHHAPAAAVLAAGCSVSDRVESLFQQRSSGEPAARKLVIFLLVASTMATAACVLFAEALHHTLETILG